MLLICFALLLAPFEASGATTLATYRLRAGWCTFGLVLPRGAATGAVQVGTLQTQTDVKTTWPDGSIRFAVVTVKTTLADSLYPITAASAPAGSFTPVWPSASVTLTISGTPYVATFSPPSGNSWLSGPNVIERRAVVTPGNHPCLRVVFDVRAYADGAQRVDVAVENILNVTATNQFTYNVNVAVGGQTWSRTNVSHHSFSRWRKVFAAGGLVEGAVTPDFMPFFEARAIPEYLPGIPNPTYSTSDATKFDILKIGTLSNPMGSTGGRPEIGPYPGWAAHFIVHKAPSQLEFVLRHGDNAAGAWPIHITEANRLLVSIESKPDFWMRRDPGGCDGVGLNCPANRRAGEGPYQAEAGSPHQPSLAYLPYLVTGDRFYVEEMKFWANYSVLSWEWLRNGANGFITHQQVRGIGWGLRDLVDAAAYTPDADPDKGYFQRLVANNLARLDALGAHNDGDPFGALWIGGSIPEAEPDWASKIAPWMQAYVDWALVHAQRQGFTGGGVLLDRITKYFVDLYNAWGAAPNPSRRDYIPSYRLYVVKAGGAPFSSLDEMFTYQFVGSPPRMPKPEVVGAYGVEMRLIVLIGMMQGRPGADAAHAYLMAFQNQYGSLATDVLVRSQFAITLNGLLLPGTPRTGVAPGPPTGVRIIR